LPSTPDAAAFFRPNLAGVPKRCASEEASLGKLLLVPQVASKRWTAAGDELAEVVDAGDFDVALVAEVVALAAPRARAWLPRG
jgi:hypothetical protein